MFPWSDDGKRFKRLEVSREVIRGGVGGGRLGFAHFGVPKWVVRRCKKHQKTLCITVKTVFWEELEGVKLVQEGGAT